MTKNLNVFSYSELSQTKDSEQKLLKQTTAETDIKTGIEFLFNTQPQYALEQFMSAIKKSPKNPKAYFQAGIATIELDMFKEASSFFKQAITLQDKNDPSPQPYLYLAQLSSGNPALVLYDKALEIIENKRRSVSDPKIIQHLKEEFCQVCSAVGELYMTDLCEEKNAAAQCKKYISRALKIDPKNPELLQTKASVIIADQAATPGWKKMASDLILESIKNWETYDEKLLSFDFRVSAAKICIELELFSHAVTILNNLFLEDDSALDVLYLLAFSYYKLGKYQLSKDILEDSIALFDDVEQSSHAEDEDELVPSNLHEKHIHNFVDAKDSLESLNSLLNKVVAKMDGASSTSTTTTPMDSTEESM